MKPRLLDLFCGAGGAAKGYSDAGFEVVGWDIEPQKGYPYEFHQGDVMNLTREYLRGFHAIHASPPCQGYTELRHAPGTRGAPKLIPKVRGRLLLSGALWIIENVEGAREAMHKPITLCGSMFGLGAQGCQLQRHRLFESNIDILAPSCDHNSRPVIGVYGGHARKRSAKAGGRSTRDEWIGGHKAAASEALGIDWMTLSELSESVPPAYTKFIGKQMIERLSF